MRKNATNPSPNGGFLQKMAGKAMGKIGDKVLSQVMSSASSAQVGKASPIGNLQSANSFMNKLQGAIPPNMAQQLKGMAGQALGAAPSASMPRALQPSASMPGMPGGPAPSVLGYVGLPIINTSGAGGFPGSGFGTNPITGTGMEGAMGNGAPDGTGAQGDPFQQPGMAAAGAAAAGPRMPNGLNEAFITIYKILVILAGLVYAMMIFYGFADILQYIWDEIQQRVKRTKDPNMFNKDTTDMSALTYVQTGSLEEEIYHVFQEQQLIGVLFTLAGVMILLLGTQLGTFFGMKLYSIFTEKTFKEQVELPTKMLAGMIILVFAAVAIKSLYKRNFIKQVQASLRDIRAQLRGIRSYIYNNLSDNATFLTALRTNNIDDIIDTIATVLQARDPDTCTDKMAPCDVDVERMIFTLNFYSYLRFQVPDTDPNYDKISTIFTPEGVQNASVDPTLYFYYKQPIYIPNLYPIMRGRMAKFFGKPTGKKAPNDFKANPVRERILMVNLNSKMQELNTKLARLYNLATGKQKIRGYLFAYLFYVLLFALVLFGLYYQEARPYAALVWQKIKSLFTTVRNATDGA